MIKAVIIEDEMYSVLNLKSLLQKYTPDVSVVEVIESGREALRKLPGEDFDLLFLDIQFNDDFDAFQMLEAWDFDPLHIIFVTSYNQYAIKAFKHNAIDYITKPIDKDELIAAVEKAQKRIFLKEEMNSLMASIHAFRNGQIAVKSQHETFFLYVKDILYIKADKEYSLMYYSENDSKANTEVVSSKNLGYWEGELNEYPFLRIHKSYLVNMEHIASIGRQIKLADGTRLEISRERKKEVQAEIMSYKTGI